MRIRNTSNNPKQGRKPQRPVREAKPIAEMSEAELIAEGIRAPYTTKVNFKKTPEEREKLAEQDRKGKGPSGGSGGLVGRKEIRHRLTYHLKNQGRKKDFRTTETVMEYPSQVLVYLGKMNRPGNGRIVTKYHYRGETKEYSQRD